MEEYGKIGEMTGVGDCFIDLSWTGSRGEARLDHELQKFDYECTMAAMRSMADAGYKILVSAGSQAEYGLCSGVITEGTPCNPNTEYGKFKLNIYEETKELCERRGIRFIEPRYFSLYGPGDYDKSLIMSCIKKMLKNVDVDLNECTQIWDYMYIDDAVKALLKLCESDKTKGVFNFATGNHRMVREFVLDIKTALNSESKVTFGSPMNDFNSLIINIRPSIEKLKSSADSWTATTSFIDGITKTAQSL